MKIGNHTKNMKKAFLLALILSFLLTVPSVLATINFNSTVFDLDTNNTFSLATGAGLNITGIALKAQYYNDSWFIGFADVEAGNNFCNYLSIYDLNFNRLHGAINIPKGVGCGFGTTLGGRGYDWQIINQTHILVRYMGAAPNCELFEINVSQSDLSHPAAATSLYSVGAGSCGYAYMRVTTDWDWIFPNFYFGNVRNTTGVDWFYYLGGASDSGLFTPSAEEINNPFLYYNPIWNTYDLFYDDNDEVKVLHYDSAFAYLGSETLVNLATTVNETNVLKTENGIFVTNVYNASAVQVSLFHSATATDYVLIEEQTVNISNANASMFIGEPYLAFDHDREQKILFYILKNSTQYPQSIHYLEEIIDCDCQAWYNTSDCVDEFRVQNRVCTPNLCSAESSYIYDEWCNITSGMIERHEYQLSERFCEVQTCASEWYNPSDTAQASCEASLIIDEDCSTGIQSNATLTTNVMRTAGWIFGSLGNNQYHMLLCNPLDNCYEADWLCESQYNVSQTMDYTDYYPSDTIVAHFEMSSALNCKSVRSFMKDYGWKEYRVTGMLRYCCDRECGGYKCVRRGLVDYRMQQYPDCTLNESSREVCSYGCYQGECADSVGAEQIIRSPSGDPLSWVISEAEYNFPMFLLNAISIGISTGSGIYAAQYTRKWEMGAISSMGAVLLFMTMGWIPQIIGILWILAVALLIGYMISGKKD